MKKIMLLALLASMSVSQVWAGGGAVKNVGFVRLLAAPEQFGNMAISVSGVLHKDENGTLALYLDEGSARHDVYRNGFQLILTHEYEIGGFKNIESAVMDKYVVVYGTVDASTPQPRLYAGVIDNVEEIHAYPLLRSLPSS